MRAKVVVFPINGRNWCFTQSLESVAVCQSSSSPTKLKDLWKKITSNGMSTKENVETIADFVANKMNRAWVALEKAPEGSIKSKMHSLGMKLLSRIKPTEIFLKSVSEDVTSVEITYPASLNPRLVRRRLRHVAMRGSAIHKKRFYGSVSLFPITTAFSVLPLPNIPFFWILFRAYSNWRALKEAYCSSGLMSSQLGRHYHFKLFSIKTSVKFRARKLQSREALRLGEEV